MCGIYGFVNRSGHPVPKAILEEIAEDTELRGPHAFGFIWLDRQGQIHSYKQAGRISDNLHTLKRIRKAVIAVCHTRYATHGDANNNKNNHPHPGGGGWYVHNGVIHEHEQLTEKYKLRRRSECDSEVIGLLLNKFKGKLIDKMRKIIDKTTGRMAVAGIWGKSLLLAKRAGQNLQISSGGGVMWFSSSGRGLPGNPTFMTDNRVMIVNMGRNGNVKYSSLKSPETDLLLYGSTEWNKEFKNQVRKQVKRRIAKMKPRDLAKYRRTISPKNTRVVLTTPDRVPEEGTIIARGDGWVEYERPNLYNPDYLNDLSEAAAFSN